MKSKIILGVVAAVIVIIAISSITGYNSLASSHEAVKTAEANIGTVLQRRADLIPNLISTVNSFTNHETKVIQQVTDAREALVSAQTTTEHAEADAVLSESLDKLILIVENYPEIKSDATYVSLMDELAGSENRIAVARKDYNDAVQSYNTCIITFPGSFFASI